MIADGSPAGASLSGRSHNSIHLRGVIQVKVLGSSSNSLIDRVPLKQTLTSTNMVHLITMLMDRVRRHEAISLKDKVNPSIVESGDSNIILDKRLGIKESGKRDGVNIMGHKTSVI